MITAYQLSILAAGIFFMNALLTGVWKYMEISASEDARARPYVDNVHRAWDARRSLNVMPHRRHADH